MSSRKERRDKRLGKLRINDSSIRDNGVHSSTSSKYFGNSKGNKEKLLEQLRKG